MVTYRNLAGTSPDVGTQWPSSPVTGPKYYRTPGNFADDAAAAAGGVPVGGIYRKAGGTIVWRQV